MLRKEYGGDDELYVDNAMEESVPLFDVEKEMDFILFTRKNVENSFYINITDPDLMSTSHFNPKHPTRIAVHGWKPSGTMYNMMKEGNYFCFETRYPFNHFVGTCCLEFWTSVNRLSNFQKYLNDNRIECHGSSQPVRTRFQLSIQWKKLWYFSFGEWIVITFISRFDINLELSNSHKVSLFNSSCSSLFHPYLEFVIKLIYNACTSIGYRV